MFSLIKATSKNRQVQGHIHSNYVNTFNKMYVIYIISEMLMKNANPASPTKGFHR